MRINISSVTHYTPGDGVMTNEGKNALLLQWYTCPALIRVKGIKKRSERHVCEISCFAMVHGENRSFVHTEIR